MPAAEHKTFGPYTYTPREWSFVLEYPKDWNGTAAAKRAKYAPSGAHVTASRLLKNPKIDYAIQRRMGKIAESSDITAERVMKQLAVIAFGDPGEIMSWDEDSLSFVPSKDLTPEQRTTVDAVKSRAGKFGRTLEVKRADRLRALELIGRRLSMWQDKTAVTLDLGELAGRSADELEAMAKALRGGGS